MEKRGGQTAETTRAGSMMGRALEILRMNGKLGAVPVALIAVTAWGVGGGTGNDKEVGVFDVII